MSFKPVVAMTLVCSAWCQTGERVLQFANAETPRDFQEIATLIRSITEIGYVKADDSTKSLNLRGTREQLALAEWLHKEIDKPVPLPILHSESESYRVSGTDDVAKVFYVAHADTIQEFQEIATVVRSVSNIRWVHTYNKTRALAVRGPANLVSIE
jgi:hypothetical protein